MWDYLRRLWNSFFGTPTFPPAKLLTPEAIVASLRGPDDFAGLGQFLVKNITWNADKTMSLDDFKPISLTLQEGHGDCEDFAMVAQACLALMGITDNFIFGVMGPRSGHAVSIFRTAKGKPWQMYTNGVYKVSSLIKVADVPKWIAKDTGYSSVAMWQVYYLQGQVQYTAPDVDGAAQQKAFIDRMDEGSVPLNDESFFPTLLAPLAALWLKIRERKDRRTNGQ